MIGILLGALVRLILLVGPGRCPAYTVEANSGSGWFTKNAYVDSLMSAPKFPSIAEADSEHVDNLWVSLSTAGGATNLRCRCLGGATSNVLAVVPRGSYSRDTTMYGWRGERVELQVAGPQRAAVWHGGSDSTAYYVETLDAEVQRRRADHCRACGYYWLHGAKVVCP